MLNRAGPSQEKGQDIEWKAAALAISMWLGILSLLVALFSIETFPRKERTLRAQVLYMSPSLLGADRKAAPSPTPASEPEPSRGNPPVDHGAAAARASSPPVTPPRRPKAVVSQAPAAQGRQPRPSTVAPSVQPPAATPRPDNAAAAKAPAVHAGTEPPSTSPAEEPRPAPSTPAPAPATHAREIGETRPPRIVKDAVPRYPSIARSRRIGGIVEVRITVGTDGKVEEAEITRSPSPLLNQAALDAARAMVFEPALANGKPVRAQLKRRFKFGLR